MRAGRLSVYLQTMTLGRLSIKKVQNDVLVLHDSHTKRGFQPEKVIKTYFQQNKPHLFRSTALFVVKFGQIFPSSFQV